MKKNLAKLITLVFVFGLFLPVFEVNASSGYFTYRETKMGNSTRQVGQWEYEISNEKYDFSTNESVFALTRIFNITRINTFQFKYEIRGNINRTELSPVYRPGTNWWAEIWYWDEFGKLPSGNYDLQVLISVDGASYQYLDTKHFKVSGNTYNYNDYNYNDDSYVDTSNYDTCGSPSYDYNWMKTGKGISNQGSYVHEISKPSTTFTSSENVYVLVKNSSIKSADSFRIKFDILKDGRTYIRSNEVPTMYPNCNTWGYNYSWANLGRLSSGSYVIRSYIKLDNGSYRSLGSKNISVGAAYTSTSKSYTSTSKSYRSTNKNYSYNRTEMGSTVRYHGNYRYSVDTPKQVFSSRDEVKVLTRLSDITNIRYFKVRHELHKNGRFVEKSESATRKPNGRDWEYNYTESNFGKLDGGRYEIKTYISIEGDAWKLLDSKDITVSGNSYTSNDYNHDWTRVDTGLKSYTYYR